MDQLDAILKKKQTHDKKIIHHENAPVHKRTAITRAKLFDLRFIFIQLIS